MNTKIPKIFIFFAAVGIAFSTDHRLLANDEDQEPVEIEFSDQIVKQAVRPAIPFKPFPMIDPVNNKALKADDVIIVGGKRHRAEDYFKSLNDYERKLCELGYSLRNKEDLAVISQLDLDMDAIIAAARYQNSINLLHDSAIMAPIREVNAIYDDVKATILDLENNILRGFEALASSNKPEGFQVELTELDSKLVKTPNLNAISGNTHREWTFGPQNKDQVYIGGNAVFHLGASATAAEVLATARIDGKLLTQEFNLLYGHLSGKGDMSYDKKQNTAKGELKAEVYLHVLGRERYKWADNYDKTVQIPNLIPKFRKKGAANANESTPPSDPSDVLDSAISPSSVDTNLVIKESEDNPATKWLSADRRSLRLEPWRYSVYRNYIWHFMVGPVPGNGEIGIDGAAYIDWGKAVNVSSVRGNLTFGANSSVWAKGAVGVELARAGVYAELVLVDTQFNFEGSSQFRIGDGLYAYDPKEAIWEAYQEKLEIEPQVVSEIKGTRRIQFLKGSVGAFAEIPVPKETPPFFDSKRFNHQVFDWTGYDNNGVIFSYKRVSGLGSYNIFGAANQTDIDSAELDQKIDDHFIAIIYDDEHQDGINRARLGRAQQDRIRSQFASLIEGLVN